MTETSIKGLHAERLLYLNTDAERYPSDWYGPWCEHSPEGHNP